MNPKPTMPIFAQGPLIVIGVFLISAIFYGLQAHNIISVPHSKVWKILTISGALFLLISGAIIYFASLLKARLVQNIQAGQLVTTGIYAWVRHPLYSGLSFIAWGLLLLLTANIKMLSAGLFIYFWLKIMLIKEEKMLIQFFPDEYPRYQKQVNQIIPWKKLP